MLYYACSAQGRRFTNFIIIIAHFISNWEQEHCKLWPCSPCPLREISRSRSRTSPASVCMWSSPSVFLHKTQLCFTRCHKLTRLLHRCKNPTLYSSSAKTDTDSFEIMPRPFPLTLQTSVDSLSRDKPVCFELQVIYCETSPRFTADDALSFDSMSVTALTSAACAGLHQKSWWGRHSWSSARWRPRQWTENHSNIQQ